jgi:D-alanyl-D-alanine carboxypeptidase
VLLLLVAGVNWVIILSEQGQFDVNYSDERQYETKKVKTIKVVPSKEVHKGDLLLVNREYAVHENGVKKDIVNLGEQDDLVDGFVLLDRNTYLSKSVAKKFKAMIKNAANDGVNRFVISSGYRDLDKQEQLYQEHGADYALPAGYSEHNLGLSLDVGSTEKEMKNADEGKWLQENSWKYGFILRYPSNKTEVTGILYEPWHFRYVGLPHSVIMYKNDWVLEEYLEYLKNNGHISAKVENKQYDVSYYPSSETEIEIKVGHEFEISGDNISGIIVTNR